MRKSLTDKGVKALKPRAQRYAYADPELRGHYVRIAPTGTKTFVVVAIDPNGKQIWHTIGACDLYGIEEARGLARETIKAIKGGQDRTPPETFSTVAAAWMARHVEAKGLRTAKQIRSNLDRLILPAWASREFTSIKRSDIAKLLDRIEDKSGPSAADYVLSVLSMIMSWYAARHDGFASPIAAGMRRTSTRARSRSRILDDDELRSLWTAADQAGAFGCFVQLLLLTAQRRSCLAALKWDDLDGDEWIIRAETRAKGTAGSLILPDQAMAVIERVPRFVSSPFVFGGKADGPLKSFGYPKEELDKSAQIAPWQLHDLRRSSRSLMSRAGIQRDLSERILGHQVGGSVERIYDRFEYRSEKSQALRALAALIENIVGDQEKKVVAIR